VTRPRYLPGQAGAAAFAQAGRRARVREPADPQPAPGVEFGADAPARVAALMTPCLSCPDGCPRAEHHLPDKAADPDGRTYCTRHYGPRLRRCPCGKYEPGPVPAVTVDRVTIHPD
jgi:hypothetical protein